MNLKRASAGLAVLALAGLSFAGPAAAVPVSCGAANFNHMGIDSSVVSSCLGAGTGNINGNWKNDAFLSGSGSALDLVGIGPGVHSQDGSTGTFTISSNLWDSWSDIAIGFKFGTGNQPNSWFVFQLNPLTTSGDWEFTNMFGKGGGLSHIQLYGANAVNPPTSVPEPGTLALLGIGMLGVGIARRRKRQ